jgi:FlaA1/EpsC-like NDP-sugar epimerase
VRELLRYRRPLVVVIHLGLIVLSNYAAFWLRFEGEIPRVYVEQFRSTLAELVIIRALMFARFRLYEGLWRYTSISDLRDIISGVALSSVIFFAVVHWGLSISGYPHSVLVIDTIILIFSMGGLRLSRRIHRQLGSLGREKRVLIYGAGDAGEMIVRDMQYNSFYSFEPVGFVDDDPRKTGKRIHGIEVLGTRHDLAAIMARSRPDAVLVAIARAEASAIRSILQSLEPFKVPIQTIPNLRDILNGRPSVNDIRTLAMEDLLDRIPVSFDLGPVRRLIEGQRVLVTGAGGSIGSELARQIATLKPASLSLLDRYENGLHEVALELRSRQPDLPIESVIADVADEPRVATLIAQHRPGLIFHAAAHKHVPLMETNPCEAVKNNVRGTRVLAETARRLGVDRFILISTDKAVNPSSVMGATKRVAELIVQDLNGRSPGTFATVRFGNVLASNGSVVQTFMNQIKAGGPVTVTHPDMRRYFMLIREAVHLVLQAAAMATGGEIFVLEMGEQIKIVDLARNLIRLAGFVPDVEIPITFIGPRLGEQLSEELVGKEEAAEPSAVERILRIVSGGLSEPESLRQGVSELERVADHGDARSVTEHLCRLVPTYEPSGRSDG